MPQFVRNFWVSTQVDGRRSNMEGGPASEDGGFDQSLYIRNEGKVEKAVQINGYTHGDDLELVVRIGANMTFVDNGDRSFTIKTRR